MLWMALDMEAFTPGIDSMHTHTALDMDAMVGWNGCNGWMDALDGCMDGMDAMYGYMDG